MALVDCPDCGQEVSASAAACPKCGRLTAGSTESAPTTPPKKRDIGCLLAGWTFLGVMVLGCALFFFGGLLYYFSLFSPPRDAGPALAPKVEIAPPVKSREGARPVLQVIDGYWSEDAGNDIVEGHVKNISEQPLMQVAVVVTWVLPDGVNVRTVSSFLEVDPLLPGQTSPFRVLAFHGSGMTSGRITFYTIFGGDLEWEKAPAGGPEAGGQR